MSVISRTKSFKPLDISVAETPSKWHNVDIILLTTTLAVSALGLLMVYSATRNALARAGSNPEAYLIRQGIYGAAGIALLIVCARIDYRKLCENGALIYCGVVALLLGVLTPLGASFRGIQAWYQLGPIQFQPSEFAKVGLVVALAGYLGNLRGPITTKDLVTVLGLGAIPTALIYLQPDLGTALVFGAILIVVLITAGARPLHLLLLGLAAVFVVALALKFGVLDRYQVDRLTVFLEANPEATEATYNQESAKTAIGNGGVTGQGLFDGSQTNLALVPEQKNDFIFTALAEQLGIVGAGALLGLYAVMMWRIWRISLLARDRTGTFLCVGVMAMLMFQIFENIGMNTGIMPITGIPLPFMSFGGSSLMASFASIGLVLSVGIHKYR